MKIAEVGGAAVISEAFPIKTLTDQKKFLGDVGTLIDQGKVNLIFNMDRVEYLITIELGSLVATMKKARSKGGAIKLVGVGEFVDNLLKMTNLKSLFEIYPTEAEALKSIEGKA